MNHQKFPRVLSALALLCAFLLVFSACGKDSDSDSAYSVISEDSASEAENPATSSSEASSEVSSDEPSSESSSDPTPSGTDAAPGLVAESARVDASYFDDAVFVGDSVSLKLEYYDVATGVMGNAKFLTSGSLGSNNALWDVSEESVHPSYQGEKMRIEDAIPLTGAKKVYIMLGMNDIGAYGVDASVESFQTLIGKILEKTPDATIYVQSVTPKAEGTEWETLNNQTITEYNEKLLAVCEENGWYYLDVASVMHDDNGFLIADYCSDPGPDGMGIHFTDSGCQTWADYLYTHTAPEKAGAASPDTERI